MKTFWKREIFDILKTKFIMSDDKQEKKEIKEFIRKTDFRDMA